MSTESQPILVVTAENHPDFKTAYYSEVYEVNDGDSLWLHAWFPEPIKNYVVVTGHPYESSPEKTMMMLAIGPEGDQSKVWKYNTLCFRGCGPEDYYYTSLPEELLEKQEFSICLTSFIRNQSASLFMEALADGSSGVWKNELRLISSLDHYHAPLATVKISCDVSGGTDRYYKMNLQFQKDVFQREEPQRIYPAQGKFWDSDIHFQAREFAGQQGWNIRSMLLYQRQVGNR